MAHEVVLTETLVETLEKCESEDAERIINKLEDIDAFPDHFLDRLKNHPGYRLRVGDFRVLIDWVELPTTEVVGFSVDSRSGLN